MIIYNVTIKINWSIASDWIMWMKDTHIPEVIATGCFDRYQFVKLLQADDAEGPTYAVQYFTSAHNRYDAYMNDNAADLRQKSIDRWGDKFIAFRSLMEVVE